MSKPTQVKRWPSVKHTDRAPHERRVEAREAKRPAKPKPIRFGVPEVKTMGREARNETWRPFGCAAPRAGGVLFIQPRAKETDE